jgi:hypothetical protein
MVLMVTAADSLTTAADAVQATDITIADDPIVGIYLGLGGLSVAMYLIWKGRKWRGSTTRQRDKHRKSHTEYVPYWPGLDYGAGIALGAVFLTVLLTSCVFLITR